MQGKIEKTAISRCSESDFGIVPRYDFPLKSLIEVGILLKSQK